MTAKARELKEYKRMKEELEALIASLEDDIKGAMGEAEELVAGEYKITYKTVTSPRLDSRSLKAELPEIAARYTINTSYRRFNIS